MANAETSTYNPTQSTTKNFKIPIGLFSARTAIKDLTRYLELVTLFMEHYLPEDVLEYASPVHTLINDYDEHRKRLQIRREISKMMNRVYVEVKRLGISTTFKRQVDGEDKDIQIITEFFNLPNGEREKQYNTIRGVIYRALGDYERIYKKRRLELLNPFTWLSHVINIPVYISRRSGINVETEKTYKMHYWILQVMMGVLLSLLIIKLGLSTDILSLVKGWIV